MICVYSMTYTVSQNVLMWGAPLAHWVERMPCVCPLDSIPELTRHVTLKDTRFKIIPIQNVDFFLLDIVKTFDNILSNLSLHQRCQSNTK